jgi:segregation and condensation protein A
MVGKPRFVLADMNMDGLVKALQKMFLKIDQKAKEKQVRTIILDRFTVEERATQILEIFDRYPVMTFDDLVEEDFSKREIITTFQAILELLKVQKIKAYQDKAFDEIKLEKTDKMSEKTREEEK